MSEFEKSLIMMELHNVHVSMNSLIDSVVIRDEEHGSALMEKLVEITEIVTGMRKE